MPCYRMRLKAFLIAETEKAYGLSPIKDGPVCWVPMSQVSYIKKFPAKDGEPRACVADIPDWIVNKDSRAWEAFEEE